MFPPSRLYLSAFPLLLGVSLMFGDSTSPGPVLDAPLPSGPSHTTVAQLDDCASSLSLSIGQAVRLPPDLSCLELEAGSYMLAYFDPSSLQSATTYSGRSARMSTTIEVSLGEPLARRGAAARPSGSPATAPPRSGELRWSFRPEGPEIVETSRPERSRHATPASSADTSRTGRPCSDRNFAFPCPGFSTRQDRWEEGDVFWMTDPGSHNDASPAWEGEAQVFLVRDNFAYALYQPDRDLATDRRMRTLRTAIDRLHDEIIPFYRQVFEGLGARVTPPTSPANGQFLVVLGGRAGDGARVHAQSSSDGPVTAWMTLGLGKSPDTLQYLETVAHELSHAVVHRFLARQGYRSVPVPLYVVEGVADYMALEILRRRADIGLMDNWAGWVNNANSAGQALAIYGQEPRAQSGELSHGYLDFSSFLRDLVVRQIRAGQGELAATRSVIQGALLGWDQLERQMRNHFPDWTFSEGALTWTLSQAADDKLPAASRYQNRSFKDVSHSPRGWTGAGTVSSKRARLQQKLRYGSASYVRIRANQPARLHFRASGDATSVVWALLRIR